VPTQTIYLLETFRGLYLRPTNLDKFCGYDIFKDGDVVAVQAQLECVDPCDNVTTTLCPSTTSTPCDNSCDNSCETLYCDAIPAKIFDIKKVWKLDVKTVTGKVTVATDNNGIQYHKLTEIYDLTAGNPYFKMTENSLLFNPYIIDYDIYNIMGVDDLGAAFAYLEGKEITAQYTDYGTETKERSGIPIVITKFQVI
jgi:hypothetical protein